MVANWWALQMSTTLTLKNIPDRLYQRLKHAAALHRRSLNSEAIVCLEAHLLPARLGTDERLARARCLRASLPDGVFTPIGINRAKQDGRP